MSWPPSITGSFMKHPQHRSRQSSPSPATLGIAPRPGPTAAILLAAALALAVPATHAEPSVDVSTSGTPPAAATASATERSLTLTLLTSKGVAPAPNTPYRVFLTGKNDAILGTPDGDGIQHGTTDAQGRTAPLRTTLPHTADDFTLIRRIGNGPWGHFFQLQSSGDKEALAGWPYILTMRQRWGEQWVDLGYTTRQGATAYFSHDVPAGSLSVSVDSPLAYDRPCFDELNAINLKFAQGDADGARESIAAMRCAGSPEQRLDLARVLQAAGQPELARDWLMQARHRPFLDRFKPTDTVLLRDRLDVERLLGMPNLVLADATALQARRTSHRRAGDNEDLANSTAYYLADFPDYLEQAEEQARQSLDRFGERPYNRATLGWILTLRGQVDEGLRLMRRSYRELPRDAEMVADYGLALWRNDQRELATRLWDEALRECVWGVRLHAALREAGYPHPYFQPSGSDAVQAYRTRCEAPRAKAKTRSL